MNIGFVVLVYGKAGMSIECINNLKKLYGIKTCQIIVVDNCSPDDTYEQLHNKFSSDTNLHLLKNKSNEGFARGNNLGYRYAKESLACDWIVVMNSDVFIEDQSFIDKIKQKEAQLINYELVAPDVVNPDGRHNNPLAISACSDEQLDKQIKMNDISVLYYKLWLHKIFPRKSRRVNNTGEPQREMVNIMPHGACVIYTPNWTSVEDKAFYPGTFLFCEELFLYDYMLAKGYSSIYLPSLVVNHIGDGSINGEKRSKKIFINSCHSKSLRLLRDFRKDIIGNWNKYE